MATPLPFAPETRGRSPEALGGESYPVLLILIRHPTAHKVVIIIHTHTHTHNTHNTHDTQQALLAVPSTTRIPVQRLILDASRDRRSGPPAPPPGRVLSADSPMAAWAGVPTRLSHTATTRIHIQRLYGLLGQRQGL